MLTVFSIIFAVSFILSAIWWVGECNKKAKIIARKCWGIKDDETM